MEKLTTASLWIFVIASGVLMGGALYETFVTQPLWAGDPPASVQAWKFGTIQKGFFQTMTPGWTLCAVLVFVCSFAMPAPARTYARVIGVVGVLVMITTLTFFIPILQKTQANGGAGLSGEEITRLTNRFVHWNILRMAAVAGSWIAGLRVLTQLR
jgi:hypothetical protein